MSTNLLHHGWCLKGYHYVRTDYPQGQIIFTVQLGPGTLPCPACGCRQLIHHGETERTLRQVPIGLKVQRDYHQAMERIVSRPGAKNVLTEEKQETKKINN